MLAGEMKMFFPEAACTSSEYSLKPKAEFAEVRRPSPSVPESFSGIIATTSLSELSARPQDTLLIPASGIVASIRAVVIDNFSLLIQLRSVIRSQFEAAGAVDAVLRH